jgi:hypothetical protein
LGEEQGEELEVELFGERWGREESIEIAWDMFGLKIGLVVVVVEVLLLLLFAVVGVKSQFVMLLRNLTKVSV